MTAHDVVYGVRRALDPQMAAPQASVDYVIKGAEAVHLGNADDLESLGFDTAEPPFDNVKVRQAFAMALDREDSRHG